MSKLKEIKQEFQWGKSHLREGIKNLVDNDIIWLTEKIEQYEETLENLEECFDDFGKVTGDMRFVEIVRKAKRKLQD